MKNIATVFIDEILCFDNSRKKSIITNWVVLFIAMIFLTVGILVVFNISNGNTYEMVISILTIVTHAVVIVNTMSYLWSSSNLTSQYKGEDEKEVKRVSAYNMVFSFAYWVTIGASVYIIYSFLKAFSVNTSSNWIYVSRLNEFISLGIFLTFLAADILKHQTIKLVEKHDKKESIQSVKNFFIKQIAFIGFPGFIGIAIITLISESYYSMGILDTSTNVSNVNGTFISGFSAGAVAMHILLTQCIFAVLITRKKQ